jgi:hypothetical protein
VNEGELIRKYEPVLKFAKEENFFPMKIEEYVQHCSLHALEGDQGVLHIPPEYVAPEDLADAYFGSMDHYLVYADLRVEDQAKAEAMRMWIERQKGVKGPDFDKFKKEIRATLLKMGVNFAQVFRPFHLPHEVFEQALRKYDGFKSHAPVYYYRISGDGGYTVIQYWFFYAYNDFATSHGGVNDHEGDWEGIQVFLKGDEPAWAVYSAHGGHGEKARQAWQPQAIELEGTHPVVYVAAGSHANYYTPELDSVEEAFAPGDIVVGGSGGVPWGDPQPLDKPWFTQFAGRWGARQWDKPTHKLADARGGPPTGPKFTRQGDIRIEWDHPAKYAGLM